MLSLYSRQYPILDLKNVKELFLVKNMVTRQPLLSILVSDKSDFMVVNTSNSLITDIMGYSYFKENGFALRTIVRNENIARVILGETTIFHRRIFEAIEYLDGPAEISIFSPFIALVQVPIEPVRAKYERKLNEYLKKDTP